jgi:hypothetical protein
MRRVAVAQKQNSENSKANRIETMKGPAESGQSMMARLTPPTRNHGSGKTTCPGHFFAMTAGVMTCPKPAPHNESAAPPRPAVTAVGPHSHFGRVEDGRGRLDDLWSNPYTAKKRTVDPAQPPLLRQDARASLAERDLARETTQARLGRPGHRVTADPKPIREAGK